MIKYTYLNSDICMVVSDTVVKVALEFNVVEGAYSANYFYAFTITHLNLNIKFNKQI